MEKKGRGVDGRISEREGGKEERRKKEGKVIFFSPHLLQHPKLCLLQ